MKYLYSVILLAMLASPAGLAAPGAHGPNGEHLDAPASAGAGGGTPHMETFSEMFELVGNLSGSALRVMIDRYETNAPVFGGQLEVQFKDLKAQARFHADAGDYAVDDPAFLKAISAPGKHALLFTFVAGDDSDLLEGTLEVTPGAAAAHAHQEDAVNARPWPWIAAVAALLTGAVLAAWARKRRRNRDRNRHHQEG